MMSTPKKSGKSGAGKPKSSNKIAVNRRARHDYEVLESFEAGLVLTGDEVKSLRNGTAQIAEAYGQIRNGEAWLMNMHIPPYTQASVAFLQDPDRPRKLLLHTKQIAKLKQQLDRQPLTMVPLSLYFAGPYAKVNLALVRRKVKHDKRRQISEQDARREMHST